MPERPRPPRRSGTSPAPPGPGRGACRIAPPHRGNPEPHPPRPAPAGERAGSPRPTDYLAWRATLQPSLLAGARAAAGARFAGVDVEATLAAVRELLAVGPRTQGQLRSGLGARFPGADPHALGLVARAGAPMVMRPVEHRWCFARDAAFVLAADHLGAAPDPAARPEELVRRCLAAFGPASAADVVRWSGVPGAAAILKRLRGELLVFRTDRRELFDLPDAPRPGPDVDAPVRYLPAFDNLLLAHADRTRVIADEHRTAVYPKNMRIPATFLVDGQVAGTWTVTRRKDLATLTLAPFGRLSRTVRRDLEREGRPLALVVEPEADDARVVVDARGGADPRSVAADT